MSSAGAIIYKAFMPTLKMGLCIVLGFIATKKGWLTAPGAKGLGAIVIQVTMPALVFSSMVSAFTPDNIKAFGPLVVVAIMYQLLGLISAWIIREMFYVPIDFRWGILVAGLTSNWGNLPTAIVQTMAKEAPFNPAIDVDLGVAYIAIFILIMNTIFWGLGVHKICAWDFEEKRRRPDQPPIKERWFSQIEATKGRISKWTGAKNRSTLDMESQTVPGMEMLDRVEDKAEDNLVQNDVEPYIPSGSRPSSHQKESIGPQRRIPPTPNSPLPPPSSAANEDDHETPTPHLPIWRRIVTLIYNLPNVTKAVIISIPIATLQPLKSLFAETEGWSGSKMPYGPDGNPPLYFIIETTAFLGAIAVPGALLLLGASFARLKIPKDWKELPIGAIISLAISKMILVPIFGIFVIQALRDHTSLFPREDKIRTFAAILLSGTPSQVVQLVVTQSYNPDGTAETLSSFLLLQYLLMFVLSTALAAIALYIVER